MVFTDNGPQFSSEEFKRFAKLWGFTHETASPLYPKSNGKAESAVRVAKEIMKKAKHAKSDVWKAILEYWNTPSQGLASSPVQRMFGRRTRGCVPNHPALFTPARVDTRSEMLKMRNKQKVSYDHQAHDLPPLCVGDSVRIQEPGRNNQPWSKATVSKTYGQRSYQVIREDGVVLRHNRQHLKSVPKQQDHHIDSDDEDEDDRDITRDVQE